MDGEGGGGARKGREEGLERGGRGVGEGEGTKRGSIPVRANIKPKLLDNKEGLWREGGKDSIIDALLY